MSATGRSPHRRGGLHNGGPGRTGSAGCRWRWCPSSGQGADAYATLRNAGVLVSPGVPRPCPLCDMFWLEGQCAGSPRPAAGRPPSPTGGSGRPVQAAPDRLLNVYSEGRRGAGARKGDPSGRASQPPRAVNTGDEIQGRSWAATSWLRPVRARGGSCRPWPTARLAMAPTSRRVASIVHDSARLHGRSSVRMPRSRGQTGASGRRGSTS